MTIEGITYFPRFENFEEEIVLDPREIKILHKVNEQISNHYCFPTCCAISADALAGEGFSRKTGWFYTDLPDDMRTVRTRNYRSHGWNMLGDKIIDLTAIQFNPFLYDQNKLPSGILVIQKGNNLFQRYITKTNPITRELGLK